MLVDPERIPKTPLTQLVHPTASVPAFAEVVEAYRRTSAPFQRCIRPRSDTHGDRF